MEYTYRNYYNARTVTGMYVTVPDEIMDNQRQTDVADKSFPVKRNGKKKRAVLCGDLYGLHGSGTGDTVVRII